jgi:hypothetical protein
VEIQNDRQNRSNEYRQKLETTEKIKNEEKNKNIGSIYNSGQSDN